MTTIHQPCALALEDGAVFIGQSIGADGSAAGEVVFNTAMTGYQEILTDPSYRRQIVAMTSTQIGNYGVNDEDAESGGQHLAGFVVREASRKFSNHRANGNLATYLRAAGVIGLAGVDTRALTRRLRAAGAMRGVISTDCSSLADLVDQARAIPSMEGCGLVDDVAPRPTAALPAHGDARCRVAVIDCGAKRNILRQLVSAGCAVTVVPPTTPAERILTEGYDGLVVSNGPGDPAVLDSIRQTVRGLIGRLPMLGICLGHQLLALALGAKTYKLKFGHHGANHPVLCLDSGAVEITSQNHGFAVDEDSLIAAGAVVTHRNLYDGSIEGFRHEAHRIIAVQHHPEAAPGPWDARPVFDRFLEMAAPKAKAGDAGGASTGDLDDDAASTSRASVEVEIPTSRVAASPSPASSSR